MLKHLLYPLVILFFVNIVLLPQVASLSATLEVVEDLDGETEENADKVKSFEFYHFYAKDHTYHLLTGVFGRTGLSTALQKIYIEKIVPPPDQLFV